MSIAKNKIIETRKRLKEQKEKDELKLKAIQQRLKKAIQKIAETEKKEEADRRRIAGAFILEKVKNDSSLKVWFDGEINGYLKNAYERNLFGFLVPEKEEANREIIS